MTTTPSPRRNALYALLAQYLANQPDAKPRHAWAHFTGLAENNLLPDVLTGFDGEAIEIRPDPERLRTKRIDRQAFVRQLQNIRKEIISATS